MGPREDVPGRAQGWALVPLASPFPTETVDQHQVLPEIPATAAADSAAAAAVLLLLVAVEAEGEGSLLPGPAHGSPQDMAVSCLPPPASGSPKRGSPQPIVQERGLPESAHQDICSPQEDAYPGVCMGSGTGSPQALMAPMQGGADQGGVAWGGCAIKATGTCASPCSNTTSCH